MYGYDDHGYGQRPTSDGSFVGQLPTSADHHRADVLIQEAIAWLFGDFELIERLYDWVYDEHDRSMRFLANTLRPGDVVITHFLPTHRSVSPQFAGALNNCFWVSDAESLIVERQPALWIHGHTHQPMDYSIDGCRIVCNPLGYPWQTNPDFDDHRLIDLAAIDAGPPGDHASDYDDPPLQLSPEAHRLWLERLRESPSRRDE